MPSSSIYRLWSHLAQRRKKQVSLLLLAMIFTSFLEAISIGAVIPFSAIITAPEKVFNYKYIKPIIGALNFHQPQELLLPLTLLFVSAIITSTIARIFHTMAAKQISLCYRRRL